MGRSDPSVEASGCWCDERSRATCNDDCARIKRLGDLEKAASDVVNDLDIVYEHIKKFPALCVNIETLRAMLNG